MTVPNARPKAFSPDQIASAALEILEKEGPEALSFRRVGEALGTSHVTVYRRCGSFEGLLDLCADHVAADFPEIDESLDWVTATQLRFEAAYEMWAEHSDLILLMKGRSWQGQNIISKFYEPAMRTIVEAGLSLPEAARVFSILYRLTIGSVISTRANHWNPWDGRNAIEKLGPEKFPTLVEVGRVVDNSDLRAIFRDTLHLLIVDLGPADRQSPDPKTRDSKSRARKAR